MRQRHVALPFLILLFAGSLCPAAELVREARFFPAEAKPRKTIIIPETAQPPALDGKLNDPVWQKALKIEGFTLYPARLPDSRPVQLLLMYDPQALYVGMRCGGDDTKGLDLRPQKSPDVWGGHMVELWLDPTATGRKGVYQFCLNAIGTRYDESPAGPSWQGKWSGQGSVGELTWEVELVIPFIELGVKAAPTGWPWLANFARGGTAGAASSWTGGWDDPGTLGMIFFGNDTAWRTTRKAALSLILDREEYDPLDTTAVALAKFDPGRAELKDVRLKVSAGGAEQTLTEVKDTAADLTLDMSGVPLGAHTATAALLDKDGRELARAESPFRKKVKRAQVAPPARQQVPVAVWPVELTQPAPAAPGASSAPSGATAPHETLSDWPISTGVPFPQGVLLSEKNVRLLDAQGREVPCQVIERGRWNRLGSVRWLGLDFQGRLDPKGAAYRLEFGAEVQRAPVAEPIQVTETADRIAVDTGALRFSVRKKGFNLLDEVRLGLRTVSKQEKTDGLLLVDGDGKVYRASNDPTADVRVEEAGPLRATIRAAGWYVQDGTTGALISPAPPTDRLGLFVTRITAFRGKPYVAVQHVFIVTHDTGRAQLKNIAIGQRLPGARGAVFSLDGQSLDLPRLGGSVRLYQASSDQAQIESSTAADPAPRVLLSGKRADGWCRMSGLGFGMTLCLTDPWQLFPKEIEAADGALWLHLWPKHGRPYTHGDPNALNEIYKLWWCHTGEKLDFTMPAAAHAALKASPLAQGEGLAHIENGRIANAQGVAFENNFLLWFDEGSGPPPAAKNALWQAQPHAWADPQWVCDSGVFGRMTPRDPERFPNVERFFETAVFSRLAAQEYARDYGQFNWLDLHSDNSAFSNGAWGLNRVWNQGHHGSARIPWYLYARSGDPRYLQFARRLARHVMNVDVTHYATPGYDLFQGITRPNYPNLDHRKGAMFHVKGFAHWGGDSALAGHLVNFDFMLWDYYVTGNRRALDVTQEWLEGLTEANPSGYSGREGTQMIAELTALYQSTFDARALDLLDRFARRIQNEGPFAQQGAANFAPFLERYLPFTGNDAYRRKALEWNNPSPNLLATLYYETGDKALLERAVPGVFFRTLHGDPRPVAVMPQTALSPWYNVSYDIQYLQPYLRALVDAGMTLAVDRCERQRVPGGARVYVNDEKDADFALHFNYLARARALQVTVLNPQGQAIRSVELAPNADFGPAAEKLTIPQDLLRGSYAVQLGAAEAKLDHQTAALLPFTPLPTVCEVAPNSTVRFYGDQLWYFRTAADQTTLELDVAALGREGGVEITSGDGRAILAQAGRVGEPALLKVGVKPGELYRLLSTQDGSNPNFLIPRRHALVLARTAEEWFSPR